VLTAEAGDSVPAGEEGGRSYQVITIEDENIVQQYTSQDAWQNTAKTDS